MCKKVNNKNSSNTRIDKCIKPLIKWLNERDYKTIASCCGHGKYPITIVVEERHNGKAVYKELFTNLIIKRERKFYSKDNEGDYFIPEVKLKIGDILDKR